MSNNLDISQVASNQDQKEVTINDANGELDAAITEQLTVEVDSSNAATLSASQFARNVYFIIDEDGVDPADADITITCPAQKRGLFVVRNDTDYTVTIEIASQPLDSPFVDAGGMLLLSCDGTNVERQSEGVSPFDVGSSFAGSPTASEIILEFIFTRDVTFPAGLTGSQGSAGTASTGTATFNITQDGTPVGTMVFDASASATFAMATATSFTAGEVLRIVAPASPDATLADLVFTLSGTRD